MAPKKSTAKPGIGWTALGRAPTECPWRSVEDVTSGWSPVEAKMKSFVKALRACPAHEVALSNGHWYLRYRWPEVSFVGGAPTVSPALPAHVVQAERTLPADLLALYGVHDGFGVHGGGDDAPGWDVVDALMPTARLEVLSAVCGRTPAGVPDEDPNAFLAFLIEGTGERLGIYKQYAGNPYKDAMRWDHETHEVSKAGPVFTVLAKTWLARLR